MIYNYSQSLVLSIVWVTSVLILPALYLHRMLPWLQVCEHREVPEDHGGAGCRGDGGSDLRV